MTLLGQQQNSHHLLPLSFNMKWTCSFLHVELCCWVWCLWCPLQIFWTSPGQRWWMREIGIHQHLKRCTFPNSARYLQMSAYGRKRSILPSTYFSKCIIWAKDHPLSFFFPGLSRNGHPVCKNRTPLNKMQVRASQHGAPPTYFPPDIFWLQPPGGWGWWK